MRKFYSQLFEQIDQDFIDSDLHTLIKNDDVQKLNEEETKSIDGLLTIKELSTALHKMKNNKTPGMDGFPSEFFIVFWLNLKVWILLLKIAQ